MHPEAQLGAIPTPHPGAQAGAAGAIAYPHPGEQAGAIPTPHPGAQAGAAWAMLQVGAHAAAGAQAAGGAQTGAH